ncbi:MAG: hypothetical protein ACXIT4_04660 [Erythrobacter sp.]
MNNDLIMTLAIFTLSAALFLGIWSYTRAKRAKDNNEGAAAEGRNPMKSRKQAPPPAE